MRTISLKYDFVEDARKNFRLLIPTCTKIVVFRLEGEDLGIRTNEMQPSPSMSHHDEVTSRVVVILPIAFSCKHN